MNKPSPKIILTGFMGAGKTTVGESLAANLNCRMIDLDNFISGREGRTIANIIDKDGEARFREMETRALIDTLQFRDAKIVALGGGTWTLEQNRALIGEEDCLTVWLDAPFELCWQRIRGESDLRPLARDKVKTQQLYYERKTSYELAALHVQVTKDKSIDDIAAKIIESLPE